MTTARWKGLSARYLPDPSTVAPQGHALAPRHDILPVALARERWFGPPDIDRSEGVGLFFERNRIEPAETTSFTSHAAALAAAAAGEG